MSHRGAVRDSGEGIHAEDVDLAFVPEPVDTLTEREIGEQTLLIDGESGVLHALDDVGSVVWDCFDGIADLREITEELADGFDAPLETVQADVLVLTKRLASVGLLSGIVHPKPEAAGVAIGAEFPRFRLPDLEGRPVDLADLRGRRVLLVNWSPACGFCVGIAGELAELEDRLGAEGIETVLVSYGDAEANSALLDEHDAHFRTLLRPEDASAESDPFGGRGTPSAYLLDVEGAVEAPLALGAGEVPALARRAARIADPVPADSGATYLPVAGGACAPGAASAKRERSWRPTVAYRIGEYVVGIRTDSSAADDAVARMLASYRIGGDPFAPANYSVVLPGAATGAGKDLGLLVSGNTTLVRSRSPRRVLHGLVAYLSWHLDAVPTGLLPTATVAAVGGDSAFLLPTAAKEHLEYLQPRLARIGYGLVDEPRPLIDPERLELVVPEPALEIDLHSLEELAEPRPSKAEAPRVGPGRYGLHTWYIWNEQPEPGPAERALGVLSAVVVPKSELAAAFDRLSRVFEQLPIPALWMKWLDQLAGELERR